MARFNFGIGTGSTSGIVNVENLPTPCLVGVWRYKEAQETRVRGDLSLQDYGPGEVTWVQSIVRASVRDQWRIFCPGASAEVFIRTRVNDDRNYHTFRAEMYWPEEEDHQSLRVLNLPFKFILREEIT